jgi:hypothetical protein
MASAKPNAAVACTQFDRRASFAEYGVPQGVFPVTLECICTTRAIIGSAMLRAPLDVTAQPGIVTEDSGYGQQSVSFNQNRRSRSVGTTGHVQTESAVKMVRNTHYVRGRTDRGLGLVFE